MNKCAWTVLALLLTNCSSTSKSADSRSLCKGLSGDLHYIHDSIRSGFSGYAHSPAIRERADAAFAAEIAKVKECSSPADYIRSIRRYIATFADPHVRVTWNGVGKNQELVEVSSGRRLGSSAQSHAFTAAGLQAVRFGDRYFIKAIDREILPTGRAKIGDEIKACDGSPPKDIIEQQVLPFEPVSAHEAASYRFTSGIFVRWDQLPGHKITCDFSGVTGPFHEEFVWRAVPENYMEKKFQPLPAKLYELEKTRYGHWLKIRSFAGYSEDANAQLKAFVEDAEKLRHDRILVVDVRGNTGGNSTWARSWIDGLYGYHENAEHARSYVFASGGNRAHFERLYAHLKKTGGISDAENDVYWQRLLTALREHPDQMAEVDESPAKPPAPKKPLFKGKLYVLTDYLVFSSGEIFVESLKRMPGVTQAGIATNASTFYSDIRYDVTPSGLVFSFPTMMETDGFYKRTSGEALVPEIKLNADPGLEFSGRDSLRMALEKTFKY